MLQLGIYGIAAGSLFALVALGLVLVHKAMHIVNFAQGEIGMFAAFIALSLATSFKIPMAIAAVLAIGAGAILALIIERLAIRPVLGRPEAHAIIITIGVFLALNAGAGWMFGADTRGFPRILKLPALRIGDLVWPPNHLVTMLATALLMIALAALFRFTKIGLAMRATQQNPRAAQLMGIRVGTVYSLTWAMAGGLGALTAMLIAPITGLSPQTMVPVLVSGLAAAVLGGFDNIVGAVMAGLLLGLAQTFIGAYLSLNFVEAFTFAVIIAVLVIRPAGIFTTGKRRTV